MIKITIRKNVEGCKSDVISDSINSLINKNYICREIIYPNESYKPDLHNEIDNNVNIVKNIKNYKKK
jgi:hypothetical protein